MVVLVGRATASDWAVYTLLAIGAYFSRKQLNVSICIGGVVVVTVHTIAYLGIDNIPIRYISPYPCDNFLRGALHKTA